MEGIKDERDLKGNVTLGVGWENENDEARGVTGSSSSLPLRVGWEAKRLRS